MQEFFTAAVFSAFMLGALVRYGFGFEDQRMLRVLIGTALCLGGILLPKIWHAMANH